MIRLSQKYGKEIRNMLTVSKYETSVTEENVYQMGNNAILPFIDVMIEENLLPGSRIDGFENLEALAECANRGEPCLLLLEHYSNFDLPALHFMLRKRGSAGQKIAEALVAIAGFKLNESNPVVLSFAEAYTRLVIYPSRSLEIIKENLKDPKELVSEMLRSSSINRSAMRNLGSLKQSGKIILVFPSGTRFRPWDPGTKKGVREIDSYIKSFAKMCLVAINGEILTIGDQAPDAMQDDNISTDTLIYTASPVIECASFRSAVHHELGLSDDKKQAVADKIMAQLNAMHEEVEKTRLR